MSCQCKYPDRCSCREPHAGYSWAAAPSPDDYIRRLEDEQILLQHRLRRLEQELEELRPGGAPILIQS